MSPSPASRFGGFAAGHFVVTALCAPLLFCLPYFFDTAVTPLTAVWMMALYLPAGWVVSALRGWSRPAPKEGLKAVLCPALFAWGWALVGWLLTLYGQYLPPLGIVGIYMLLSTYVLAAPSFALMLAAIRGELALTGLALSFPWYGCMFLAGLLPPLLFFLGSLLPHRVKEDLYEKTDGTCCGNPSAGMPGGPVDGEPVQPGGNPTVRPLPPDGAGGTGGGLPERGRNTGAV